MTKKRVHEIYMFLAAASMKRLTDEEKIAFIRLLRQMKPVSNQLAEAANDAYMKAMADGESNAMEIANRAAEDIATEEVDIDTHILTPAAYERLALGNDWNFGQMEEVGELLIKE